MYLYLGYAAAVLIGLSLGLLGGGGSILTVPVLVYLMGLSPVLSTAYALFVVGSTAAVGALRYVRQGLVALPTAAVFLSSSLLTVLLTRRLLLPAIPGTLGYLGAVALTKNQLVLLLFALLMLGAATFMIRSRAPEPAGSMRRPVNYPLMLAIGAVVGLLSGLVGAGGGFLIIPALVLVGRLPMKQAVGTSLLIIAANSLLGFAGDVSTGMPVRWLFLLEFLAFSLVGIGLGTYLSRFVSGQRLKPAFGWFTLVVGAGMLLREVLRG